MAATSARAAPSSTTPRPSQQGSPPVVVVATQPSPASAPPSRPTRSIRLTGQFRRKGEPHASAAAALPDELVVEILTRLPAKSLYRCTCVSRAWRALISDPANRRRFARTLSGLFISLPDGPFASVDTKGQSCRVSRVRHDAIGGYCTSVGHSQGRLLYVYDNVWENDDMSVYFLEDHDTEEWTYLTTETAQGSPSSRLQTRQADQPAHIRNKNRSGEPTLPDLGSTPHRSKGELGQSRMEAAKKPNAGAAEKRRHGSTALFVAVDYAFLLAFAGFLAYLVGSRILPSVAPSA
nr:unnamed protein product [Digitaria exilis]